MLFYISNLPTCSSERCPEIKIYVIIKMMQHVTRNRCAAVMATLVESPLLSQHGCYCSKKYKNIPVEIRVKLDIV